MNLCKFKYILLKFRFIIITLIIYTAINYTRIQHVEQIDRNLEPLMHSYMPVLIDRRNPAREENTTFEKEYNQPTEISTNRSSSYEFFNSTSQRPIYILWSRWRRGSSFLGKLLSYAKSKTFYSYEPLHALGLHVFHDVDMTTRYAMKFLRDIMHCRYDDHQYMIKYFVDTEFYFFYNPMTKRKCSPVPSCNNSAILNNLCQESKLLVIKLLRLSLKYGHYLLNKYPEMKIIYLARDPRGTLKSRSRLMWCLLTKDCHDPSTVCKYLQEDLDYSKQLLRTYPNRFQFVRYEDLSLNTESTFKSLWEGLGQKFSARIRRLINKHTKVDLEKGIYGLKKDSKKNTFSWRASLDHKTLKKIQDSCEKPMTELGYYRFNTEMEYESNVSSLEDTWKSDLNKFL